MTVVPLQNNVRQVVPLQKQEPTEPIKPMFTPEEAKALSAAAQAKLNNADWVAKYREMSKNATPRVDSISMQSQMAAALRDPVYGQATAAGLAAGEGMLNSWIAGINSKARRDEANLANERWIKAMDDLAEERKLRRDELAESKQVFVPRMDLPEQDAWLSPEAKAEDIKRRSALAALGKAHVAKNAIEAQALQDSQSEALKKYQDWLAQQQRTLIPGKTNPISGKDVSKLGLTSGLELLNSQGSRSSGGLIDRLFNNSTFQNKAARQFESMGGSRNTVRYDNLAQYANNLLAAGNPDGARKLNQLKSGLASQGDRIIEIVGSDDAAMPVYIRTNKGVYQMLPTGEVEPTQFTVE